MKKTRIGMLFVIFVLVFVFSGYKIVSVPIEYRKGEWSCGMWIEVDDYFILI